MRQLNLDNFFNELFEEADGLFEMMNLEKPDFDEPAELGIDMIRAQGPAVITFWNDGTRTVSKYNYDEEENEYNVLVPVFLNILKKVAADRTWIYELIQMIDKHGFNEAAADVCYDYYCSETYGTPQYGAKAVELCPAIDAMGWV